jgi:hypothetical protein
MTLKKLKTVIPAWCVTEDDKYYEITFFVDCKQESNAVHNHLNELGVSGDNDIEISVIRGPLPMQELSLEHVDELQQNTSAPAAGVRLTFYILAALVVLGIAAVLSLEYKSTDPYKWITPFMGIIVGESRQPREQVHGLESCGWVLKLVM